MKKHKNDRKKEWKNIKIIERKNDKQKNDRKKETRNYIVIKIEV